MSVLIVEDDPALGRLLRTLMVRERLGVRVETRGDVALQATESGQYRAIVLDLMLPGMNGVEIVRHIGRVRPELLRRIIVLTAASQARLQDLEHRSEIWSVVRKPFDLFELVRTVRECIIANTPRRFEQIEELARCLGARAHASGARAALLATSSGQELMASATFGYDGVLVEEHFPLPMDCNYPLCTTVRTGRAVWLSSLTPRSPDYPQLLPLWTLNGHALATVPLAGAGPRIGAIGWSFSEPQRFDEAQREMLVAMTNECAVILAEHQDQGADLSFARTKL